MQDLLETQSVALRQVLATNAVLREEWQSRNTALDPGLGLGEENSINLGDAHVLFEMQIANKVWSAHL